METKNLNTKVSILDILYIAKHVPGNEETLKTIKEQIKEHPTNSSYPYENLNSYWSNNANIKDFNFIKVDGVTENQQPKYLIDLDYIRENKNKKFNINNILNYEYVNIKYKMFSNSFYNKMYDSLILISKSPKEEIRKLSSLLEEEMKSKFDKSFDQSVNRNYTLKSDSFMISFTPKGKQTVMNGEKWSHTTRQETKPIRALRAIDWVFDYTDSFWEELNNALYSVWDVSSQVEEVKGSDITYYYHEDRYLPDQGSMSSSCMRGDQHQKYIKFYELNPDIVSMAIIKPKPYEDKITARALIWHLNEGTFMDRIYGTDKSISIMKKYAKKKGYYHKLEQSFSNQDDWVDENGETWCLRLKSFKMYHNGTTPYMDTFRYVDEYDDKEVWISNDYNESHHQELTNTDGNLELFGDYVYVETREASYPSDEVVYDANGNAIHEDDAMETVTSYGETTGYYVHYQDDNYLSVSHPRSDANGYYIHQNDYVETGDEYIAPYEECWFDPISEEYYFQDGARYTFDYEGDRHDFYVGSYSRYKYIEDLLEELEIEEEEN